MGHIAPDTIEQMPCVSCEYGKATCKPIKKSCEKPRASKFGDEIHSNVWGPSPVRTPGHKEYYVSFTNDHTWWTHLKLLASKNEAYKSFKAWAKLHFNIPAFKVLHSDRGGEYLGKEFTSYLASKGNMWKLAIHDTPEYNDVSKHLNQTLLEQT